MVPVAGNPGGDGLVVLVGRLLGYFYIQCEMALPGKSLEKTIASMLCSCLIDLNTRQAAAKAAGADAVQLGDVHLILYVWGCSDQDIAALTKESVLAEVTAKIRSVGVNASASAGTVDEDYVCSFVHQYWENVHVVGGTALRKWLPESFLPFPMLFEKLEGV